MPSARTAGREQYVERCDTEDRVFRARLGHSLLRMEHLVILDEMTEGREQDAKRTFSV